MYLSDYCTVPMPLAGIPAISIPPGVAQPDGGGPELPVGFQIAGPAFSDSAMLDAAHALEGAIGFGRNGNGAGTMRGTPAMTDEEFRDAVQEALDSLPPEIAARLTNVAVLVEDRHPSGRLLGLFDPRGGLQRIIIYREHHTSPESVRDTVLHEIGHYFGADEATVRSWGES